MTKDKTIFLNIRTNHGVETVDQVVRSDYSTTSEFYKTVRELLSDYTMAYGGIRVYTSQRPSAGWLT